MIKIGILGSAGYTGGELIRIIKQHPKAILVWAHSNSQAGKSLAEIHQDLEGETTLEFTDKMDLYAIDVLFLCVGHGAARKALQNIILPDALKIIDLSQDFRLKSKESLENRTFVYGLPELNRLAIQTAQQIANPGCFATALQLALLPLAASNKLNEPYITAITGSTGAGQNPSETTHFSWRNDNISAYKTLKHQHLFEIRQSLEQVSAEAIPPISFVPWRGPFARGIFASIVLDYGESLETAQTIFQNFYKNHPFTHLSKHEIHLKQVVNTNKCLLFLEKEGSKLIVHSAIDNLIKGASGQAVQNMNLMFGLDETLGLHIKASAF